MKIRLPIRKPAPLVKRPPKLKLKASVARSRRPPVIEEDDEFLEEPEPNMKLSHAFVVVLVLHVIAVAGVFAFNSIKAHQADVFSAVKDAPAAPALAQTANEAVPPAAGAADPSGGAVSDPSNPASATAASTASPTPAPSPAAAGAKTHTMQPGETLTKIAAQYGVTIPALQQSNGITDPTKIRAGTVLTIPEGGTPQPEASSTASATTSAATQPAAHQPAAPTATPTAESLAAAAKVKDSGEVHTVAKGDNPVKIAKKLKISYADMMTLNGNPDPRKLQIGQKLKVPASSAKKP